MHIWYLPWICYHETQWNHHRAQYERIMKTLIIECTRRIHMHTDNRWPFQLAATTTESVISVKQRERKSRQITVPDNLTFGLATCRIPHLRHLVKFSYGKATHVQRNDIVLPVDVGKTWNLTPCKRVPSATAKLLSSLRSPWKLSAHSLCQTAAESDYPCLIQIVSSSNFSSLTYSHVCLKAPIQVCRPHRLFLIAAGQRWRKMRTQTSRMKECGKNNQYHL